MTNCICNTHCTPAGHEISGGEKSKEDINLSQIPIDPITGQYSSYGSRHHYTGDCKPCVFMWKNKCRNGIACQFCHLHPYLDPKKEKKIRKSLLALLDRLSPTPSTTTSPVLPLSPTTSPTSPPESHSLEYRIASYIYVLSMYNLPLHLPPLKIHRIQQILHHFPPPPGVPNPLPSLSSPLLSSPPPSHPSYPSSSSPWQDFSPLLQENDPLSFNNASYFLPSIFENSSDLPPSTRIPHHPPPFPIQHQESTYFDNFSTRDVSYSSPLSTSVHVLSNDRSSTNFLFDQAWSMNLSHFLDDNMSLWNDSTFI